MFRFIPVLAACALCHSAAAQAIYKCSVDGKPAYGDRPCATGQTIELAVPAAPPVSPDSGARLARDKTTLLELEKLRATRELRELREEREHARARRVVLAQRQKCDRLRLRRKWALEDSARVSGPRAEAARLKARRQAEAVAVECPA
jgi:hypothetical protein